MRRQTLPIVYGDLVARYVFAFIFIPLAFINLLSDVECVDSIFYASASRRTVRSRDVFGILYGPGIILMRCTS